MIKLPPLMDQPWAWLAGGSLALLGIVAVANSLGSLLTPIAHRNEPATAAARVTELAHYPPSLLCEPQSALPTRLAFVPTDSDSLQSAGVVAPQVKRDLQTRPAEFAEESPVALKRLPEVDASRMDPRQPEPQRAVESSLFASEWQATRVPELPAPNLPSFPEISLDQEPVAAHPGASGGFEQEPPSANLRLLPPTEVAASNNVVVRLAVPPSVDSENARRPVLEPQALSSASRAALPQHLLPRPPANHAAGLQTVSTRADELTRHGFSLADRGALHSARAEFIQALRILTQALDGQSGTVRHSRALAAGLKALDEAEDFIPKGARLEADLNVSDVISTHDTPVLKEFSGRAMPLAAVQQYYTYAQEQLAIAGGNLPAASGALYGMGKVHLALAKHSADARQLAGPKAMTFHQAALVSNPRNYLAANELGVLLARYGQLADAKKVLLVSLQTSRQREAWHNLAVVHERLGESDLAVRATHEERLLASGVNVRSAPDSRVRWVSAQEFSTSGQGQDANAPTVAAAAHTAAVPKPNDKKSTSSRRK